MQRCFVRAQETDSEELRQASLEMASYWMDAAVRTECLGDSRVAIMCADAGRHEQLELNNCIIANKNNKLC